MKKIFCLVLVALLTFVVAPVPAWAASQEEKISEYDELIAIACDAFPEYEDKILHRHSLSENTRSLNLDRELIFAETRNVSDNHAVIYSEYSDGLVLLTDYEYDHIAVINSQEPGGGRTIYNVTIKATSAQVTNSYFELRNVIFAVYPTTYDTITSTGVAAIVGDHCEIHTRYSPVINETASAKANITYMLKWEIATNVSGGWTNSVLRIEVGGNGFRVIHMDQEDYLENYGYLATTGEDEI